jgi:thiamine kinase-like enzyme
MSHGPETLETVVAGALDRLANGGPPPDWLIPLKGGITNQNFRFEHGGEALVLRVGGRNTHLLGVDRDHERAASRIAGHLGIGADVVLVLPERDSMVTRLIRGPTLTPEVASTPDTLSRIVDSVRKVHAGPAFPGRFSAFRAARTLHGLALERGVRPPAELDEALRLLARIEAALPPYGADVPCHNDLLPGNFIDDGTRVRIIDWEYAAMGDQFFDLGNLAVNLALPEAACEALLARYFGEARREDLARLFLMRMASDMRECCWGYLSQGISTLDFNFSEYGAHHLHRFLDRARDGSFDSLLELGARSAGRGPAA